MRTGWRGRVGFIIPSAVTSTNAHEFYQIVPEGVSLVATPLGIQGYDSLVKSFSNLDECALKLAKFGADIIIMGGSPTAAHLGYQGELDTCNRLAELTKLPFTTSQLAAIQAMNVLEIKNPLVITPFIDEQNAKIQKHLEAHNLNVKAVHSIKVDFDQILMLDASAPYRLAKKALASMTEPVDGIYIPCGMWPTVEIIEMLEHDTGLPVVASTQAMVWKALNMLQIFDPIVGFGSLFDKRIPS